MKVTIDEAILRAKQAKWVSAYPCSACADGDHEGCRDGTRISRVPYTCPCAVNRHE